VASLKTSPNPTFSVAEAYDSCARLAHSHYENFTIASWLLPRNKRPHFYALYAFCRTTDDLGDEATGNRLHLLDQWETDLRRCFESRPIHPTLIALQHSIQTFDIPPDPFLKLIQANRMDQSTQLYPTYQDLLYYCEHSANPVGHMVLYICGYRDKERQRLSDATCTALQLTNFWQDVRRDYDMGRIYIPLEDMEQFGYTEAMLDRGEINDSFRELMCFEIDRAQHLFWEGLKLVQTLKGRVKLDVALFSKGGMSVLEAIRNQDYDVLHNRPTLSNTRRFWITAATAVRLMMGLPIR
jgi:squalene synthase HpnC